MRIIDAHLHIWDPEAGPYTWLTRAPAVLNRAYTLDDCAGDRAALGIDGVVLVQADDDDADTDAMFAAAESSAEVLGVVAHLPLHQPEVAAARLAELCTRRPLAGIRSLIHVQPDTDWVLRPDVGEGLGLVERAGLPFDLVTSRPRHLDHVVPLSERFPDLTFVIDHLGGLPIDGDLDRWRHQLEAAASNPRVNAKLSGLYGADQSPLTDEQLRPWVATALEVFGPDRLMIGSDWPIAVRAGGYRQVTAQVIGLVSELAGDDAATILADTATRVYRL